MKKLTHKFVEFIPRPLEDDVLYVSVRFRVAIHKCCCGCGNEVATNLSPAGWELIFDGETVSLRPSIGNWNFKCKSHYWITKDTVQWAESWPEWKIKRARENDARLLENTTRRKNEPEDVSATEDRAPVGAVARLWRRLLRKKDR